MFSIGKFRFPPELAISSSVGLPPATHDRSHKGEPQTVLKVPPRTLPDSLLSLEGVGMDGLGHTILPSVTDCPSSSASSYFPKATRPPTAALKGLFLVHITSLIQNSLAVQQGSTV